MSPSGKRTAASAPVRPASGQHSSGALALREGPPLPSDREAVSGILLSTGAFAAREIAVALELLDDALLKGERSEYKFIFAGDAGGVSGYVCFGPITMAGGRFDIYWIAVREDLRGAGIGTALMKAAESRIAAMGGTHVFIETSSRAIYAQTLEFYRQRGYAHVSTVPEFYSDTDDKLIFLKKLG